jgi:hypothetical protein
LQALILVEDFVEVHAQRFTELAGSRTGRTEDHTIDILPELVVLIICLAQFAVEFLAHVLALLRQSLAEKDLIIADQC